MSSHVIIAGKLIPILAQPVFAGLAGFTITDLITGKALLAIVVSALCSVLVAFIRVRPNHITASSDAIAKMLDRIDRQNHEMVSFLRERIAEQNRLLSVITIIKHKVVTENQAMQFHLSLRGDLLKEQGVEFPELGTKDFSELFKEEDRIRAEIVGMDLPE